ncbi:MAG: hypothetical protein E7Z80_03155 [Methanobrevibacter thaueri]|nr:hypothetical protein [Methanobrevibacter thaueri]
MTIQDLLKKCEHTYNKKDFKTLVGLCDEVFKKDPDNPIAMSYKSISYCFLNQPKKTLEILKKANKLHPNNYHYKNITAMAYYDLGEYEKSLKYCDEGLKIDELDWLYENKIKALLKLDRIDEATDCYENGHCNVGITDLLIETGKYSQALKYCLEEDSNEYKVIIDKIKEKNTSAVGDYYLSWIYNIKSKYDIRSCPDCGGELIPIVWGLPHDGLLKKANRGEIFLGGCCEPPNPPNYCCKKCYKEYNLGIGGLHIECKDYKQYEYTEYKIKELTSILKRDSSVFIKSLDSVKNELKGFDDKEFKAFIKHLKELECLCEPCEGYIKLIGL